MQTKTIIIGTRGSKLALWQANYTQQLLSQNNVNSEIKIIKTKGDTSQAWNTSFDKLEGKGFFTKELEEALLNKEIDLAVHSCKDLPTVFPDGLTIAAYSKRANPFDVLLINKSKVDTTQVLNLAENCIVGTSSSRRKAQLLAFRNDIQIKDIRGNVPTRIDKLRNGEFDAILLAQAGIDRLEIDVSEFYVLPLSSPMFTPAAAQGILAYQIRENDEAMHNICSSVLHDETDASISIEERKILNAFDGGCQIPLGIYIKKENQRYHTWLSYATAWNKLPFRTHFISDSLSDIDTEFIVQHIKNYSPKSVFITRNLKANDYFNRVLSAHQYSVEAQSLLDFEAVDFDVSVIDEVEWLFFSSKYGIDFFVNKFDVEKIQQKKIAVLGKGTEYFLNQKGFKADFVGDGHGDTTAKLFDDMIQKNTKVLFPIANDSLEQVQKHLSNNLIECKNLVVYKNTIKENFSKTDADIIVFTSPMNVKAYLSKYKIEPHQTIISIGRSTGIVLSENKLNYKLAYLPYDYCLVDEVMSV